MAGKPKKTSASQKKLPASLDDIKVKSETPKPKEKTTLPFTFERKQYILFVFGTFFVWLFFIIVTFSFQVELKISTETLREMTGDSIALAGIPFAILGILSVLGRQNDNYFKIALAAVAAIFLIVAFGCFLALWIYGEYKPEITQTYTFKVFVGFAVAIFVQWYASGASKLAVRPKFKFELSFGMRAFFDVTLFVLSFLIVQISVSTDTHYDLISFVWLGFSGGLAALIVLILVSITRLPEPQNDQQPNP